MKTRSMVNQFSKPSYVQPYFANQQGEFWEQRRMSLFEIAKVFHQGKFYPWLSDMRWKKIPDTIVKFTYPEKWNSLKMFLSKWRPRIVNISGKKMFSVDIRFQIIPLQNISNSRFSMRMSSSKKCKIMIQLVNILLIEIPNCLYVFAVSLAALIIIFDSKSDSSKTFNL